MFQKVKVYVTVLVTLLAISLGLSVKAGAAEDLAVTKTRIVLESYEFGPAVTKVILNLIRGHTRGCPQLNPGYNSRS